ncbi:TetR/AcrR family transcriptional regulator [Massilia sp. BJB1822]|uniref:TetR/AcrR family transcriptional regulator n=1 Tax=Massilia sp. BJB1822 TaxID=2744470 RepID=UPI001592BCBB|nr:TetR/AcrR family transcriptional regulator [Massilia sp. BJB1822]NVD98579.1 TetR/AcrR family transcriptional regulator [Massilia sp. BJB1822]
MSSTEKRHYNPARAQQRREQVLEAAAQCFARRGFHAASMAEISKVAGMSAGHIYNYFSGKDEIISAFIELDTERVGELLGELGQAEDPLQEMVETTREHVDESLDPANWKLYLEISAEASRNEKIALRVQEGDRVSREQFGGLLRRCREARGLSTDDATIDGRMEIIIAMYQGLPLRLLHNPELDRDALSESFKVALRALLFS